MPALSLDAKWILGVIVSIMVAFFLANRMLLQEVEEELATTLTEDLRAFKTAMTVEHRALLMEAKLYTDQDNDEKFTTRDIVPRDARVNRIEDDVDRVEDLLARLSVTMETFDDWANGLADRGRERTSSLSDIRAELTSVKVQVSQVYASQSNLQRKQDAMWTRVETFSAQLSTLLSQSPTVSRHPSRDQ